MARKRLRFRGWSLLLTFVLAAVPSATHAGTTHWNAEIHLNDGRVWHMDYVNITGSPDTHYLIGNVFMKDQPFGELDGTITGKRTLTLYFHANPNLRTTNTLQLRFDGTVRADNHHIDGHVSGNDWAGKPVSGTFVFTLI
jgi:hypothetical protein